MREKTYSFTIEEIPIIVTKKRMKNMYLRISKEDGSVRISAPHQMSDERIYRFAKERIDWIRVYREKYLRAKEGRREVRQLSEAELKQQKLLLSCPNLMVSLPIDAPSTASMAKALRHQKTLFGMHKVYQDADAAAYLLSFDHLYSQMVSVGFRSGNVDVVLKKIADRYEENTNRRLQSIIAILEPTLVIILSVIVGLILLSVILPLMGIMTSIG